MAGDARPLTARSVVASTLLGVHPPRLPVAHLVRSGELFGIAEGTTRTALHRMVAAGELLADDGTYELAGHLLSRQQRQDESRLGRTRPWDGQWEMAIVVGEGRAAPDRVALRAAMGRLRLAELREGVWLRPDVLASQRLPDDRAVASAQCAWFRASPDGDPAELVARLWDLGAWAREARRLDRALEGRLDALEAHRVDGLADTFVLSAAALRHFQADPLLPPELLPGDWPGAALRATYERVDAAFKETWRAAASVAIS
jgi:phenylacetic acid degradation operon negative regulatory protein